MRGWLRLALLLAPSTGLAQQPDAAQGDRIRNEIVALEERIGQANFDCDYRFFAEVEAAEFIFTDAAGGLTTRAGDLAGEKECRPRHGSYRLDEVRAIVLDRVVVFNAIATTTVRKPGVAPVVRRQRFTDVLVHRDGRWQLIAGHTSRLP